jgi:hypothetical protein
MILYTVCPVFVTRRYGGPEEGGWYWDHSRPLYEGHWALLVKSFTNFEDAVAYCNEMQEAISLHNEELPPLQNVHSVGRYALEIFEGFPKETPPQSYE